MAKISVVIPAYNASNTIRACLESVFQQSRPADEIIVVDDGSSDDISSQIADFGDRVRLLTQKNQGSAKARQTGTDAASGEYIAYLDADDWWLVDHLNNVESAVKSQTVDFLLTDLRRGRPMSPPSDYSERNSVFYPWFRTDFLNDAMPVPGIKNLFKFSQPQSLSLLFRGFPVYPSTMVVSKAASQQAGGWDIRFKRCQDFDFALRIARQYELFYFDQVHTILGLHTVNSDVNAYVLMQTTGDAKVLRTHISENSGNPGYVRSAKFSLSRKLYSLGKLHLAAGNRREAISSFLESALLPGRRLKAIVHIPICIFSLRNSSLRRMGHQKKTG